MAMSPPEVLLLLKNRDPDFLDGVFRETTPILLRMLAAGGISGEASEDLIHQTWERFFTNLDKFEGRSELRTFICGILINQIREHRRATGRVILEEDPEAVLDRTFTPDGWWNAPPPDPAAFLRSSQVSAVIRECLEGLSEQQRSAFVLKEIEQEESGRVCNVLGVSVSNLRVLLFRAKSRLRLCLEGKLETTE